VTGALGASIGPPTQTAPHAARGDDTPRLVATLGIGTDAASTQLVAAGDNPERLRNEAAFAHLCGASPIETSSGDRQANSALWHIEVTRMVYDPRTTEYIERRTKEGLTKKEAVRCLIATSPERCSAFYLTRNWALTALRSIVRGQSGPRNGSRYSP
jgi:hypothetical protein